MYMVASPGWHAHGSRAVAAGLPAGKYGYGSALQPCVLAAIIARSGGHVTTAAGCSLHSGHRGPLVSAAPDPPASAAFPLLPLLQLGPQTHAQPPATAAPPGRLDSTREDFWMGQVRGLPRPLQCLPCI